MINILANLPGQNRRTGSVQNHNCPLSYSEILVEQAMLSIKQYCAMYYRCSLKNATEMLEATVTAWKTMQDRAQLLSLTVLGSIREPTSHTVAALGLLSVTRLAHLRWAKIKSSNEDGLRWIFWLSCCYLQLFTAVIKISYIFIPCNKILKCTSCLAGLDQFSFLSISWGSILGNLPSNSFE